MRPEKQELKTYEKSCWIEYNFLLVTTQRTFPLCSHPQIWSHMKETIRLRVYRGLWRLPYKYKFWAQTKNIRQKLGRKGTKSLSLSSLSSCGKIQKLRNRENLTSLLIKQIGDLNNYVCWLLGLLNPLKLMFFLITWNPLKLMFFLIMGNND